MSLALRVTEPKVAVLPVILGLAIVAASGSESERAFVEAKDGDSSP